MLNSVRRRILFLAAIAFTVTTVPRSECAENPSSEPVAGASDPVAQFQSNQAKASQGDAQALFELARAYEHGLGTPKDSAKAREYVRQSADHGYPPAQTAWGAFYLSGNGVAKDASIALSWYRKAADQGYPLAQYAMGNFYESGHIVPTNMELAIQWYKKAAAQSNAAAECQLGLIYFTGINGDTNHPADLNESVKWLKLSADQGYFGAMNNLGLAYNNGLGGLPVDPVIGAKWLRQAAEHGNPKAQASLGEMYFTGRGVPKDLSEAFAWFTLARDAGNVAGKHSAKEAEGIMTPEEHQRGDQLIQDYHTRHPADAPSTGAAN